MPFARTRHEPQLISRRSALFAVTLVVSMSGSCMQSSVDPVGTPSGNVETSQQALNSKPLYQDPSGAQTLTQPSGTTLTINGTIDLSTPRRLGGFRYADQFSGNDIGAKINAARTDLGTAGGTIIIPKGSWTFSTPIVLDNAVSVVLQGEGATTAGAAAASTLQYNGSCQTVISARSTAGVELRNIYLVQAAVSCGAPLIDFGHSSTGSDSAFGVVASCTLGGNGVATLVSLDKAIEMTIRNNNFFGANVAIMGAASSASYSNVVRIAENQFQSLSVAPIKNAGQTWLVSGNTFEVTPSAYAHDPGVAGYGLTFIGNWCGDSSSSGTWIDWLGSTLTVQGNFFAGANTTALRLEGTAASITGNTFGTGAGIDLSANPNGILVAGNDFTYTTTPIVRSATYPATQVSPLLKTTFIANSALADVTSDPTINVRSLLPKTMANGICPANSTAIYAPRGSMGYTGAGICAANFQSQRTCTAVKYVYFTLDNHSGTYSAADLSCSSPVADPWPWGTDVPFPDTLDGEWGGGTHVVCCQ